MDLNDRLTILAILALLNPIWLVRATNAEIIRLPQELAQAFRTPDMRESPAKNNSGGTRGSSISLENMPTALIPQTNLGLTLAEYPTFFVYLPAMAGKTVEFLLATENGELVYETRFTLLNANGIVSISLPDDGKIPGLEVGKKYEWRVAIVLDPNDHSLDSFTSAWIQRVEASPSLRQELEKTTPDNYPKIYAEAGIWHETLESLAKLRQSNPDNSSFITQWQNILRSVGLEAVTDAPLLGDSNQLTETLKKPVPETLKKPVRVPDIREIPLPTPRRSPTGTLRVPDIRELPAPAPAPRDEEAGEK